MRGDSDLDARILHCRIEDRLRRRQGTYDEDRPDVERRGGKRRKAGLTSEELLANGAWGEAGDVDPRDAAIVISIGSGRCRLFHHEREFDCVVPPELAVRQKSALAVGDRVVSTASDDACRLAAVLPRRTVLSRPDPLNPHLQRLIAANIDVVIHVVSVKAPPLRPRLIDRFLIAIQRGGAQPVICVNKIDLLDADERIRELASLDPYRGLGVPVVACSVKTAEGMAELRALVEGKTCALVGHSGVGKSSILNALDERLDIATGELHKRGTGRHTTTSSTLHDLGGGTFLIDTPGIREFGLWNLTLETLRDYFPEFSEPGEYCRFNDCTHLHEPGCAVKERAEEGELSRARYDAYVRLAEDLSEPGR
jgi:ribosome biogenesis GTPase